MNRYEKEHIAQLLPRIGMAKQGLKKQQYYAVKRVLDDMTGILQDILEVTDGRKKTE